MNLKQITLSASILFFSLASFCQNFDDAVNYSQNIPTGTARFASMGGAFGALGGDFTSLSYNPAGSGIYRGSEFVFTPSLHRSNTSSTFFGNTSQDFRYSFGLNTLGYIGSYRLSNDDNGIVSWSFGVGYNKLMNYNNKTIIEGNNPDNSLADIYANNANNDLFDDYYEALFYDAYVIDQQNGTYVSALPYSKTQRKTISTNGSVGEYLFNIGANYSNKLFFGATIGIQSLKYHMESNHYESTKQPLEDTLASSFTFREELTTKGTGFKLKLGAIYKPIQPLRLGFALHLPTFYRLNDEYITSINSDKISGPFYPVSASGAELGDLKYEYSLNTFSSLSELPFKGMFSAAYIHEKIGLVSLDYEYVDYTSIRFRNGEDGYDFHAENSTIQDTLTTAMNIRAGAEVKIGNISLRGGYAYYGSPFKGIDADYSLISGGIGFNIENMYLDFGYVYREQSSPYVLYNVSGSPDPVATINKNNSEFMITIGFRY
jgi:hypothetical protein